MFVSLVYTPITGTWIGSSPEILFSGETEGCYTVALAGTQTLIDEQLPTEWDAKNREEQHIVAQYVKKILKHEAKTIEEKGPYTARAGNLAHLKTDFHFRLRHSDHLFRLLDKLHPTPAVCGLPKEEAMDFIVRHENFDRSYYGGYLGYLDRRGQSDLYVNIRCMNIRKTEAILYAGGGILPESKPESEWRETNHKLMTMKQLLKIPRVEKRTD